MIRRTGGLVVRKRFSVTVYLMLAALFFSSYQRMRAGNDFFCELLDLASGKRGRFAFSILPLVDGDERDAKFMRKLLLSKT